jgi:hypothetical protein
VNRESESYTNPKRTIELLEELQRLQFDHSAFKQLHHFGDRETINSHLSYCEKTNSFKENDNNARVQHRLKVVLDCWKRYHQPDPSVFASLASASVELIR